MENLTRHTGQPPAKPRHRKPVLSQEGERRPLTEREWHVLRGMANGESNREIGRGLGLSEDTVKTYARRVFLKFGAADRANAVSLGYRLGYLRLEDHPPLPQEPGQALVIPYWKHKEKAVALPAPSPVAPEPDSARCCLHCRAMMPILSDGEGEKGMGKRMVKAIRIAKQRQESPAYGER